MTHLNFQDLFNYLEHNLDTAEREKTRTHLAACEVCRDDLKIARQTLAEVKDNDLTAPPSELVHRTVVAFRRKQARVKQLPRREATLHFDSWAKGVPPGVRGLPQEHQLLFSIDEGAYDLDLQIAKDPVVNSPVLRGQILGTTPPLAGLEGFELRLFDAEGIERRGLTDELGRFRFSQLAEGSYSLRIILDDHEVLLRSLNIEN